MQGDGELKKLKVETTVNYENIENRKKFMRPYLDNPVECEPYVSISRIVYLKKTF